MTLTVHADIRAAVRTSLIALSGIPTAFAWEGEDYQPTVGTPFLQENIRPIYSQVRALGRGGTIEHRVAASLNLFYPARKGTLAIEAAAAALMAGFQPGNSLVYGDTRATILQAERAALLQEPDWLTCPVTVTISAHTSN